MLNFIHFYFNYINLYNQVTNFAVKVIQILLEQTKREEFSFSIFTLVTAYTILLARRYSATVLADGGNRATHSGGEIPGFRSRARSRGAA